MVVHDNDIMVMMMVVPMMTVMDNHYWIGKRCNRRKTHGRGKRERDQFL